MLIYELKKIFNKKSLCWGIVIFMFINIINISINIDNYSGTMDDFNRGWQIIYKNIKGPITDEKITYLENYYNNMLEKSNTTKKSDEFLSGYSYGDMNIALEHLENIKNAVKYKSDAESISKSTKAYSNYFHNVGNTYMEHYYNKVSNYYNKRAIDNYYDYSGINRFLNYNFSSILVLMLCVLYSSVIFSEEKSSGMFDLIYTSFNGKKNNTKNKILTIFIFVFVLQALFEICDFITFSCFYNMDGIFTELYCIEDYKYTPLNIKIISFVFLRFLYKFTGFITISTICATISKLFDNFYSSIISYITLLLLIFSSGFDSIKILSLNPIYCIQCYYLFNKINLMNFFNVPIPYTNILLIGNLLFIIFLILFCLKFEKGLNMNEKFRVKKNFI